MPWWVDVGQHTVYPYTIDFTEIDERYDDRLRVTGTRMFQADTDDDAIRIAEEWRVRHHSSGVQLYGLRDRFIWQRWPEEG